ncbi:hypothetical protein CTI12_AA533770 [Artemisia annua]|uniref:Uncharacterized protein n=1 Tax=Artemisia annua TaxID=35608 RepID=A0A2U1KQI2_ARTAN|nr:hypothetical protein CTI12_AA533770 [Artemisia annua]
MLEVICWYVIGLFICKFLSDVCGSGRGLWRVEVLLDVRDLKTLCNDLVIEFFMLHMVVVLVMICQVRIEPSWTCLLILLGFLVRICWMFLGLSMADLLPSYCILIFGCIGQLSGIYNFVIVLV